MSAGSGVDWNLPTPSPLEVLGREGLDWNGMGFSCVPPPPKPPPLTISPSIRVYVIFLYLVCLRLGSFES
jgi:hypothetical protein